MMSPAPPRPHPERAAKCARLEGWPRVRGHGSRRAALRGAPHHEVGYFNACSASYSACDQPPLPSLCSGSAAARNAARSTSTTVLPSLRNSSASLLLGVADLLGRLAGRLAQHLLEDLLVGVAELRPHMAADDGQQRLGDVAGQHDVRLHLVELLRHDGRQRILLPVDRALLQREIDFGEGDRRRVGADRLGEHQEQAAPAARAASCPSCLPAS